MVYSTQLTGWLGTLTQGVRGMNSTAKYFDIDATAGKIDRCVHALNALDQIIALSSPDAIHVCDYDALVSIAVSCQACNK